MKRESVIWGVAAGLVVALWAAVVTGPGKHGPGGPGGPDLAFTPPDSPCRTLDPPPALPGGPCSGEATKDAEPVPCPYPRRDAGKDVGRLFEPRDGVTCLALGDLLLPTGRIAAHDGLIASSGGPIDAKVPPGRYPVIVARDADRDFVGAVVLVSSAVPARWRLANPEEKPTEGSKPDGEPGGFAIPVDSGTTGFTDLAGWCRLAWHIDPDWEMDVLQKEGVFEKETFDRCADGASGSNVIAARSGAGDGVFPVYVGEDERGAVVAVAVDYLMDDLDDTDGDVGRGDQGAPTPPDGGTAGSSGGTSAAGSPGGTTGTPAGTER